MAIIIKTLGANTITVSNSSNTLYAVPSAKSAVVNNVRLVNGDGNTSPTLNLYAKPSGATARRIHKKDFTLPGNQSFVMEDAVTLGQGDAIQLDVGAGTAAIAYMVNGIERE